MLPLRRLALTALAALALAGCAGKPIALPPVFKPDPTVVRLQLTADAMVNADSRGRATPVVVRYYVLQNTAAFDSADFFSLFERDEALLGTAVLAREETTLKPGQVLKVEFERDDGRFIYEIRLLQADGRMAKLKVDAVDGRVLKIKRRGDS